MPKIPCLDESDLLEYRNKMSRDPEVVSLGGQAECFSLLEPNPAETVTAACNIQRHASGS